jgi:hypothetical protein
MGLRGLSISLLTRISFSEALPSRLLYLQHINDADLADQHIAAHGRYCRVQERLQCSVLVLAYAINLNTQLLFDQ